LSTMDSSISTMQKYEGFVSEMANILITSEILEAKCDSSNPPQIFTRFYCMHVSFSYRFHRFLLSTNSNYHQMVNNAQ
jgi:hypothetical protein